MVSVGRSTGKEREMGLPSKGVKEVQKQVSSKELLRKEETNF